MPSAGRRDIPSNPPLLILFPYKLIPVQRNQIDNSAYNDVTEWADPDLDAAANAFRQLYNSPELRKRLVNEAKRFIADHFSIENFRSSVQRFMD